MTGTGVDRGYRPNKTGETVGRRQNNGSVNAVSDTIHLIFIHATVRTTHMVVLPYNYVTNNLFCKPRPDLQVNGLEAV